MHHHVRHIVANECIKSHLLTTYSFLVIHFNNFFHLLRATNAERISTRHVTSRQVVHLPTCSGRCIILLAKIPAFYSNGPYHCNGCVYPCQICYTCVQLARLHVARVSFRNSHRFVSYFISMISLIISTPYLFYTSPSLPLHI